MNGHKRDTLFLTAKRRDVSQQACPARTSTKETREMRAMLKRLLIARGFYYLAEMPQKVGDRATMSDAGRTSFDGVRRPLFLTLGVASMFLSVLGLTWLFSASHLASPPATLASRDQALRSARNIAGDRSMTFPDGSANSPAKAKAADEAFAAAPRSNSSALSSQPHKIVDEPSAGNAVGERLPASELGGQLMSFLKHDHLKEAIFSLARVSFLHSKATLTAQAHEELQQLAEILRTYPGAHIIVGVSSEEAATKAALMKTSMRLERSIRAELVRLGIPTLQVTSSPVPAFRRFQAPSRQLNSHGSEVWIIVRKP
jgi:outer membrane protein OmpA-like peptidoglycan-associated protein